MKFYKYGVEVFDTFYTKYGGHWQWFGKILSMLGLNWHSLAISFCKWEVGWAESFYHDGVFHKALFIGFIVFAWESNCE